jgi:hypothetical protein
MTYAFLSPAQGELQEAVDFYNARQAGLGEEFAAEVVNTITAFSPTPKPGPGFLPIHGGVDCSVSRMASSIRFSPTGS